MSWVTLIFVLLLFQGSAAAAFQIPRIEVHFISYDTEESCLGICFFFSRKSQERPRETSASKHLTDSWWGAIRGQRCEEEKQGGGHSVRFGRCFTESESMSLCFNSQRGDSFARMCARKARHRIMGPRVLLSPHSARTGFGESTI